VTVGATEPVRLRAGIALITAVDVVVEEDAVVVVVAAEMDWTAVCIAGANGPRAEGPLYPLEAMTASEARRIPTMTPVAKFTLMLDHPR